MRYLLLILICFNLSAQDGRVKHFYASAFGAVAISEVTYQITDRPILSGFIGGGLMFLIGYGKEKFHDDRVSNNDLFNDGFGSATGAMCWAVHFDINDRSYKRKQKDFIRLTNAKRILE